MKKIIKKKLSKIAFLDRDGVINYSNFQNGYIGNIKYFKWYKGAKKAIKLLNQSHYKVVIVTNQSGIARGFFTEKDVNNLHRYIKSAIKDYGGQVNAIYYCPYHKDGKIKEFRKKSKLRKPEIGMFKLAQKKWKIDKYKSFMIGDQKTDMLFAKKANISGYLFNEENLYEFVKKKVFHLENLKNNKISN